MAATPRRSRAPRLGALVIVALVLIAGCTPAVPGPTTSAPTPGPSGDAASPSSSGTDAPSITPTDPPAGAARWQLLDATGPDARSRHTWTVDGSGTVAYLFGGQGPGDELDDLWAYDLTADAWTRLEPAGDRPSVRAGHVAAWVEGLGLVVFGGSGDDAVLGDLWAFDPDAGAWRTVEVVGEAPTARSGACAAVAGDGRLWLVGGQDASGAGLADVWTLDPASASWTAVAPSGTPPDGREGAECWWTEDGRFVVSGGMLDDGTVAGDRWVLDAADTDSPQWTESPATDPARAFAASTRTSSASLAFGGIDGDGAPLGDLVVVDAASLDSLLVPPADVRPDARSGAALVDDPGGERSLLFGGSGADGPSGEIWAVRLP